MSLINQPLAEILRPKSIDEIVGQNHLLGKDKCLNRLITNNHISNMIFYGPPGVGKSTVANIIAQKTKRKLYKLNGTVANTSNIKEVIEKIDTFEAINGILLYLDEIQYFSKKQQQVLLEFIETGKIILIASTTENPYFSIYNAILSRCMIFEFKLVRSEDIEKSLYRAIEFLEKEENIKINISKKTIELISNSSGGDVRKAISLLETVYYSSIEGNNKEIEIKEETINSLTSIKFSKYNKEGDEYYDLLSAFQKSMRGSDPQAGVYYLSRLLLFGDLTVVCRRLLVCACEDVGLAYPQLIPIVKSCVDIAMQVGLPEARIPLSDAVILTCLAPKSDSAYLAVNKAYEELNNNDLYDVPNYLKQTPIGNNKNLNYKYPHNYKNNWILQDYLPDEIKNKKYYEFGNNKNEQSFKEYWNKIKFNEN